MTAQRTLFVSSLDEKFERWVKDDHETIEKFLRFAQDLKRSGSKRYGIKGLAERVRWHVQVEKRGEFKVNNSYLSRLARLLVKLDPSLEGMFEFRRLSS